MVTSLDIEDKPQLSLTTSVLLPGRTLTVIQVNSNLKPEQRGQIYEIKPNCSLSEEYPNLYIVPMMHNADVYKTESVPLVLINFLVDDIFLLKGEIMGYMQSQSLDISEIMTETSTEPLPILIGEGNITEVLQEQQDKKFIKSLADIKVHQKIELKDANVSDEHQKAFKQLCDEYKDIF